MDLNDVCKMSIHDFKKYVKYNTSPEKLNLLSNIINNRMLENKNKIIKLCELKSEYTQEYQKYCDFIELLKDK